MRVNELPLSPSRNVLTIGMPPATAASKLSATQMAFCEQSELMTVPRQQRLVGGDYRLAGRKRGLDHPLGRIALPADDFDQHIDRRVRREHCRIGHPAKFSSDRCRAFYSANAR